MNDGVPVNEQSEKVISSDSTSEALNQPHESSLSAGAQLSALREARGWTTLQIASQLNLANRQIEALEADNYAALPGMVIVRGFIRSYAKVLQADPAPILAEIADGSSAPAILLPERNRLSTSFSEANLSPSGRRRFSSPLMIVVAVLAMMALVLFAVRYFGLIPTSMSSQTSQMDEKFPALEVGEFVEVTPLQTELVETASAPNSNESNVSAVADKPSAGGTAAPLGVAKDIVIESKPATAVNVAVDASKPSTSLAPIQSVVVPLNSKDALAIKVREDSWVEIKRADNSVLVSRLLKAGTSEVVAVTEPVTMVIGNAAGVDVTLRGKSVDVMTGNTSNVARLNLK